MASSARIEELERKFNENPRRYFAPLANEYRKAGDVLQAISICRIYVPQQPAHMSGHIVFGQALFEAGEFGEARGVFEAALTLDPENLIALRHLGDIAKGRGEVDAARTWYRRVLDADPRNEEVAALLTSLEAEAAPAATRASSWADINPERTLELPPDLLESATRETVLGDLDTAQPPAAEPSVATATEAPQTPAYADTLPPPPPLPTDVWTPEPTLSSTGSFDAGRYDHAAAFGLGQTGESSPGGASGGVVPSSPDELGLESMEFTPPPRTHADAPPVPPSDVAPAPASATPTAFVTETMAELYLQQGFRDEALDVYRQLLAQNPSDATLRERVEQLERGSTSSVAAAAIVSDSVIEAAQQRRAAPSVRTIRAFFGELAARRVGPRGVAASPASAVDGQPTEDPTTPAAAAPDSGSSGPHDDRADVPTDADAAVPGSTTHDTAAATSGPPMPAAAVSEAPTARREVADSDPTFGESAYHEPSSGEFGASALLRSPTGAGSAESTSRSVFGTEPLVTRPSGATDLSSLAGMSGAEYDVTAYDAGDMSSMSSILSVPAPTPAAGVPSVASATPAATPAATTEAESKAPAPVTEAASAADAAAAVDAPAAETTPQDSNAATDTPTAASAEPASSPGDGAAVGTEAETPSAGAAGEPPSRTAMQTGSVNVLFPQRVAGPDEAAAAALAGAFGGPSPRAESPVVGRAARPAAQELSLDRVFRETPAPAEPRREAGAFSFDQFFGDTPPGLQPGAPPAPDAAAPSEASDVTSADAEQFSSWLSGLKKK